MYGIWLTAAAVLFWVSWLLMPGVGVTDARQIFELVASQRSLVAASVLVQLLSATLYVPAVLGVHSSGDIRRTSGIRWGAGFLMVGAIGCAADAVLHLLAYAMTAPGVQPGPMIPVMAFMQGPGLVLLAPMIVSFFAGGWILSEALGRMGVTSRWNGRMHPIAFGVALAGGALAAQGVLPSRTIGLVFLAIVSGAQAWTGLALQRHAAAIRGGSSNVRRDLEQLFTA